MPAIIGLLCVWGCEDWIEPALKQAVEYCDEVLVNVSSHTLTMDIYEDRTKDVVMDFKNITIVEIPFIQSHHASVKPFVLNKMMSYSKYFEIGNWIWILDVDEYFTEKTVDFVKGIIEEPTDFNQIWFEEKFFYINMQLYLEADHRRIYKIEEDNLDPNFRFVPAQNWCTKERRTLIVPRDIGMFHYGTLTNPYMRQDFWLSEYQHQSQMWKFDWHREIFMNYDLNNQEYWLNKNKELTGCYSPWHDSDYGTNDGKLFEYNGEHPKFIQETNLVNIKDFRTYYDSKKTNSNKK
uniref:Glycosyltransferase 2-like domain-containing protein n=1 Tax=viral metagenome TaxID=1070528 RepID=A0A6M3IXZ2_9ZZZZ